MVIYKTTFHFSILNTRLIDYLSQLSLQTDSCHILASVASKLIDEGGQRHMSQNFHHRFTQRCVYNIIRYIKITILYY